MADSAPGVPPIPVTHALVLIPQALPLLYFPLPPPPKTKKKKDRVVYLQSLVLNLVNAHDHLALTDPELLRWYLSLCLEDRKIIQDEGGLHQFLLRHPDLNFCQDLIFVKYERENAISAETSIHPHRTVRRRGSCECVDGAPRVFALRCTMCPQHGWTLFYSSAEGGRHVTTPLDPAAHILNTLHRLDSDYNHMKQQILAAVPLEYLSVAAAHRAPMQEISDGLPHASSKSPHDPQKLLVATESECEENCSSQVIERTVETEDLWRRADAPQSCSRGLMLDKWQTVICEDVDELWYDAEDDLQLLEAPSELREVPAGGAATLHLQQGDCSGHADLNSLDTESTGGESNSALLVSNPAKEAIQPPHHPSSPTRSRADVAMSPNATQTFVSQTWGTMGSICALTAQLQKLHPNTSRASIMAALTVLTTMHRGALCSLPLESVRDMTSDLLSRQTKD